MRLRAITAAAILSLFGCGGDSDPAGSDAAPQSDAGPPGADGAQLEQFAVEFTTSTGSFVIDVTRAWSPNGADRFRELVEDRFYDDTRFFRVVSNFVVQFGINGDPVTQANWTTNTIDDDAVVESNLRGYVTFAKTSNPNSRTTQLFINYVDNSFLDASGFSPIGVVRSGLENVDALNAEYGEAPDQALITSQGNAYLDSNFPNLDSITTARILLGG